MSQVYSTEDSEPTRPRGGVVKPPEEPQGLDAALPEEEIAHEAALIPEDGETTETLAKTQVENPVVVEATLRRSDSQRPPSGRISWWFVVTALAFGLVLGVGMLAALRYLARPLAMLVLAIAIALALDPLVDRLSRGRISRGLASVLVFLAVILIFVGLGALIVPSLVTQAQALIERIPRFITLLQGWIEGVTFVDQDQITGNLFTELGTLAGTLVSLPLLIFSSLLDVLLMLFIALYWLISIPKMKGFALSLWPKSERPRTNTVLKNMGSSMGGYVRGSVINGFIVGLLTYLGLVIIGVDYAVALALLAGILEFVPIIGPLVAGAIIVSSALLQSPALALIALIYILIMQQLESNILVPYIMRRQANVSSLLVLLAVYAGSSVGGLMGTLADIPLAGAIQVLVTDVIAPAVRRNSGALRPPPRE